MIGGASLAGIGFTVALFMADRTFAGTDRLATAKFAILVASVAAVTVGALVLTHHRVRSGRPDLL